MSALRGPVARLDVQAWRLTLAYLDPQDLYHLALTCRACNAFVRTPDVWCDVFDRIVPDFGFDAPTALAPLDTIVLDMTLRPDKRREPGDFAAKRLVIVGVYHQLIALHLLGSTVPILRELRSLRSGEAAARAKVAAAMRIVRFGGDRWASVVLPALTLMQRSAGGDDAATDLLVAACVSLQSVGLVLHTCRVEYMARSAPLQDFEAVHAVNNTLIESITPWHTSALQRQRKIGLAHASTQALRCSASERQYCDRASRFVRHMSRTLPMIVRFADAADADPSVTPFFASAVAAVRARHDDREHAELLPTDLLRCATWRLDETSVFALAHLARCDKQLIKQLLTHPALRGQGWDDDE